MNINKLVYGEDYLCYSGKEFIGVATFVDDPFIGDSFVRVVVHKTRGLEEEILKPDTWVLNRTYAN